MIRPYQDEDAVYIAPIHTTVFPGIPLSTTAFRSYISSTLAHGGKAWTITEGTPIGYALTIPVPGLPHIVDLKGCITPSRQRQGLGSRLVQQVIFDLRTASIRQIAHQVRALDSPAAHFLRKNGFTEEHEEWLMMRDDLRRLPLPEHNDQALITTLASADAVTHFQRLFSASFAGLPWDQPYSQSEIEGALENASDIIFLTLGSTPIGFAWLHLETGKLGVIEPVGVLPKYQGQGFGRFLLLSALHELARRGATRAQIGAWRINKPAIHLYQSLGFTHRETIIYLAYDLSK